MTWLEPATAYLNPYGYLTAAWCARLLQAGLIVQAVEQPDLPYLTHYDMAPGVDWQRIDRELAIAE